MDYKFMWRTNGIEDDVEMIHIRPAVSAATWRKTGG